MKTIGGVEMQDDVAAEIERMAGILFARLVDPRADDIDNMRRSFALLYNLGRVDGAGGLL